MKRALLLTFFIATSAFSQQAVEQKEVSTTFEYTDQVSRKIEEVKSLPPKEYLSKINSYRDVVEEYINHKKRVCSGEFSTIILGSKGLNAEETKKIRLSPEERELCFRELKALQINFVNNMFAARKKYLEYVHEKRIEELSKAREEALGSIHSTFSKSKLRTRK